MARKSRDKGQRGELEVRDLLRRVPGFEHAERTVQARHGGRDASDVEGTPYHVEVKCHASAPSVHAAMRQAREEADEGRPIAVFTRRTTGPIADREWLVTMRAEDWIALQVAARTLQPGTIERQIADLQKLLQERAPTLPPVVAPPAPRPSPIAVGIQAYGGAPTMMGGATGER